MIRLFEKITKIDQEAQNQKLRLFAKVDLKTKIQILEQQKQLFHKLKSAHSDTENTILTLASLILAIDAVAKELDDVNLNAIKLRSKNNKSKIKRQKLMGYWVIVRTLKLQQNMSFRDIATYFKKYHKLQISYSTVYEIWNELEKKGNKNNEKSNF